MSEFELLASIKEEIGASQLSVDEPNLSCVVPSVILPARCNQGW
jgi:hypothetical protein